MTSFDLALLVAAFLILLVVLGVAADAVDRREARRRNQARRLR